MIQWHALEGDQSQVVNKPGVHPRQKLVGNTVRDLRRFLRANESSGSPAVLRMFDQTFMLQRVVPLQALWLVEVRQKDGGRQERGR